MIIVSKLWNKLCGMSNAALPCTCRRAKSATGTTQSDDDVFPREVCRKVESAGNGVLSSGEKNFSVHRTYMNFSRPRKRASETALYALRGSLLPENGTNATPFLSDVYNKGTRARKRLADVSLYALRWLLPQNVPDTKHRDDDVYNLGTRRGRMQVDGALSGRSMVEMLGVLAIIGVLSVGAISGYSKAMFKYKLNKQTEQLNTVINSIARNLDVFRNSKQNESVTPLFIKMGEIPSEMYSLDKTTALYDVFNTEMKISHNYGNDGATNDITLFVYPQLDKKSSDSLEICKNIVLTAKENHQNITMVSTISGYGSDDFTAVRIYGDSYCSGSNSCLKDLALEDIYRICTSHINRTDVHLKIIWYLWKR